MKRNKELLMIDEKLGFMSLGQFITNPFFSECGRFELEYPTKYYNLSESQILQLLSNNKIIEEIQKC